MMFIEVLTGSSVNLPGTNTTTLGTRLVFEQAGGVHAFRPSGFMGHPNALAALMVFLLPLMLLLLMQGKRALGALTWYVMFILFCLGSVALLLTLSRAGWISCAAAGFFMLYIGYKRGVILRKYINMLFLGGTLAIMIAVLVFPTIYLRITESDERSSESRLAMMYQAMLIIERNPVLGVGIGGYNRAARANIPEFFANLSPWFQDELLKGIVHNKYLLVAAEMGIIGLVIFLLMLWRFVMAVPRDKQWTDPMMFVLALGLTAGIFGQVIFYLFDHFYEDQRITLLYVYLGLLLAVFKMKNQQLLVEAKTTTEGG
jgi:O-antigen ligase